MNIITYTSSGTTIRAERYEPSAQATTESAHVIIAHGSDGVTDNLNGSWASKMRSMAEAFASRGLTVTLPYYFEKTGTEPGVAAMQSMFGHMEAWRAALGDAVALARGTPVALVGFSLGGYLSLRLRGVAAAVVEYFAPLLEGLGGPPPAVRTPVQIHHGEDDRLVDVANASRIVELLREEGSTVELHQYRDAGHGFGGAQPGDAEAWRLSMPRTMKFVSSHLESALSPRGGSAAL